jgi:outer membrane biosynthesis protein TonB
LILVLLFMAAYAQSPSADSSALPAAPCSWSAHWKDVEAERARVSLGAGDTETPPKRTKGTLSRPAAEAGQHYTLEGSWVIEVVITAKGKVVDAKILRSASTPRWTSYEASLIKDVLKWQFEPAILNGKAVGACMSLEAREGRQ